jgi:hypothetical protein
LVGGVQNRLRGRVVYCVMIRREKMVDNARNDKKGKDGG